MPTTESRIPCGFGCANEDIRHYGVEYICAKGGYTALYCEAHKCNGTCCLPITADRIGYFYVFCDCGLKALYKCNQVLPELSMVEVFFCAMHYHKGSKCCVDVKRHIEYIKETWKEESRMAKKKKKKSSRMSNAPGSKCPAWEKAGKYGRKRCGGYASHICEKEKRFVCYDHAHKSGGSYGALAQCCSYYHESMTTKFMEREHEKRQAAESKCSFKGKPKCDGEPSYFCDEKRKNYCYNHTHKKGSMMADCCNYDSAAIGSMSRGSFEHSADSEFGSLYGGERGVRSDEAAAFKEAPLRPCTTCKEEGDYWCKKRQQWRCMSHSHNRWDCCDLVEDGRKPVKEVKFDNANV